VSDRQTDRQTDRRTEFSSLDCVCIACSAVKSALFQDPMVRFAELNLNYLYYNGYEPFRRYAPERLDVCRFSRGL